MHRANFGADRTIVTPEKDNGASPVPAVTTVASRGSRTYRRPDRRCRNRSSPFSSRHLTSGDELMEPFSALLGPTQPDLNS